MMGGLAGLSELNQPLLLQLYAYWNGRRDGRRFPVREDIDPLDLKFILGSLILIDIEPDPLRFRYRLFGSEIARRQGFDMTGKYNDQHPWPEFAARVRDVYKGVMENGEPALIRRRGLIGDQPMDHQSLILPLGRDKVEMILVGVIFSPADSNNLIDDPN
jgi:hypothetical protein